MVALSGANWMPATASADPVGTSKLPFTVSPAFVAASSAPVREASAARLAADPEMVSTVSFRLALPALRSVPNRPSNVPRAAT